MRFRCLKDALGLGRRKADALAEDINRRNQFFMRHGRDHVVADLIDIGVGTVLIFRRQGVSAEQGGDHTDLAALFQRFGGAQHFQLVAQRQTVAGFDFDRGDAAGHQGIEARQGAFDQVVFTGGTGGGDGRKNATAGVGDLFIGGAIEAQLKFVGAIAGEDEVGVTVNQSGRDQPSTKVNDLAGEVGVCASIDNAPILRSDHAVFDHGVSRLDQQSAIRPDGIALHGFSDSPNMSIHNA